MGAWKYKLNQFTQNMNNVILISEKTFQLNHAILYHRYTKINNDNYHINA